MKVYEWDEYIKEVTGYVRFKQDHLDIRLELQAHLEDRMEDFLEDGCSEEEAKRMALEVMGDAREVGEALDKEHGPVLGWIWWFIRACRILMVVLLIPTVINMVLITGYTAFDVLRGFDILPEDQYGELIFLTKPDVKGQIDDVHIIIDEVRRYESGTLEVCYRTWTNPLSRSQKWTFSLGSSFYDEDGEGNHHGGGSSTGGFLQYHRVNLEEFSMDSDLLIIDYDYSGRKFYAEIPITEAGGALNLAD